MAERYPYRHHGPSVHGSKLADFLISEVHLREDGLHPDQMCDDCPPDNYPTDKTRCLECPRRSTKKT